MCLENVPGCSSLSFSLSFASLEEWEVEEMVRASEEGMGRKGVREGGKEEGRE